MIKSILVLQNGMEVKAGARELNALQSISIEEACNDGEDLSLGSTCSAKMVVDIITPRNQVIINAGEKVILYEEEDGIRRKKGVFNAEKPQKKNSNVTRIEAYDNISLLDKDVTEWFNSLYEFPYTAYELADMVVRQCGLVLANENIPNGSFLIPETKFESVTARQIVRWIGELCGCFCIANSDGDVFYKWYSHNDVPVVATKIDGATMFLGGGLRYEDYQTEKIDAIKIIGEDGTATLYPANSPSVNVYVINANPFLNPSEFNVEQVAINLYNRLKNIAYNPCKVDIPASFVYSLGDILSITDANGESISAFAMKKNRVGQKERIESTGNAKRNGATELYDTGFKKTYGTTRKNQKYFADIDSAITEQGAKISLVVSTDDNGNDFVNSAEIVAAINENNESSVKISADKLELSGYATFTSLENEGETIINGANLQTGTVEADVLKTGGTGQTGTVLGNNLMFNADVLIADGVEGRYIFFVDPALYNVFIGVDAGTDAQTLRLHAQGGAILDSYAGERMWLGHKVDGNQFLTKNEVLALISDAIGTASLQPPRITENLNSESFYIENPNTRGTIYYKTTWRDTTTGKEWQSDVMTGNSNYITVYPVEFPPNGGYVGVVAWVSDGNATSAETSAEMVSA